jgi:methionyl aminopeptidase
MTAEAERDLIGLKRIGKIVALTREALIENIRPGITTAELDAIAKGIFTMYGARSAPQLTYNFPGATCISVNNEAAHGIPGPRMIGAGDLVNVDVSAERDGYFADSGATVVVGPGAHGLKAKLCHCSRRALARAIAAARPDVGLNHIGRAIYQEAKKSGFTVIKNLCGHGIGRGLHEGNLKILNYDDPRNCKRLNKGLVLAVETFISTGSEYVVKQPNGWTLATPGKNLVAQFEHTDRKSVV